MKQKAGIVPFYITNRGIEMLFMVSSDAAYGGADPQLSKGNIDRGENTRDAAVREGLEELGLLQSNFAGQPLEVAPLVYVDDSGVNVTVTLYAVEVKNKQQFVRPHYETERVVWMTAEEFNRSGRPLHRPAISRINKQIRDQMQ